MFAGAQVISLEDVLLIFKKKNSTACYGGRVVQFDAEYFTT